MRRLPLAACLVIGSCAAASRPAPAVVKAPKDEVPPVPPDPATTAAESLELRATGRSEAGPGWVSVTYTSEVAAASATLFRIESNERLMAAIMAVGVAMAPRLPGTIASGMRQLASANPEERANLIANLIGDHRAVALAACPELDAVFRAAASAPPPVRGQMIWDGCEMGKLPLVRREEADQGLAILAAILWVELVRQGGMTAEERFLLREIAATARVLNAPWEEQRRWLAGRPVPDAKSPQPYERTEPPRGVEVIEYPSGEHQLPAWLSVPGPGQGPAPALVYLHGGFAFAAEDFAATRPFRDAGYVVLTPTFRGENGNPGRFELFGGEVDDAAAAVRWLAGRPEVDPQRIYAFGHATGGTLASLLTLVPALPLVHSGSAGAIMLDTDLADLQPLLWFDPLDRRETASRVLLGHTKEMLRPHYAWFAGLEWERTLADVIVGTPGPIVPMRIELADHHDTLGPALAMYLLCTDNAAQCPISQATQPRPDDRPPRRTDGAAAAPPAGD